MKLKDIYKTFYSKVTEYTFFSSVHKTFSSMDDEAFFDALVELKDAVYKETGTVREMVQDIVPTYKMPKTGK